MNKHKKSYSMLAVNRKNKYASKCGASGGEGAPGFQPGNTCGGDGDGSDTSADQGGGDVPERSSEIIKDHANFASALYGEDFDHEEKVRLRNSLQKAAESGSAEEDMIASVYEETRDMWGEGKAYDDRHKNIVTSMVKELTDPEFSSYMDLSETEKPAAWELLQADTGAGESEYIPNEELLSIGDDMDESISVSDDMEGAGELPSYEDALARDEQRQKDREDEMDAAIDADSDELEKGRNELQSELDEQYEIYEDKDWDTSFLDEQQARIDKMGADAPAMEQATGTAEGGAPDFGLPSQDEIRQAQQADPVGNFITPFMQEGGTIATDDVDDIMSGLQSVGLGEEESKKLLQNEIAQKMVESGSDPDTAQDTAMTLTGDAGQPGTKEWLDDYVEGTTGAGEGRPNFADMTNEQFGDYLRNASDEEFEEIRNDITESYGIFDQDDRDVVESIAEERQTGAGEGGGALSKLNETDRQMAEVEIQDLKEDADDFEVKSELQQFLDDTYGSPGEGVSSNITDAIWEGIGKDPSAADRFTDSRDYGDWNDTDVASAMTGIGFDQADRTAEDMIDQNFHTDAVAGKAIWLKENADGLNEEYGLQLDKAGIQKVLDSLSAIDEKHQAEGSLSVGLRDARDRLLKDIDRSWNDVGMAREG